MNYHGIPCTTNPMLSENKKTDHLLVLTEIKSLVAIEELVARVSEGNTNIHKACRSKSAVNADGYVKKVAHIC